MHFGATDAPVINRLRLFSSLTGLRSIKFMCFADAIGSNESVAQGRCLSAKTSDLEAAESFTE
jgi:hypothetical protein